MSKKNVFITLNNEIASPLNDFAFKKIFANPENDFVLIDFLNCAIWPNGEHKIKTIQYLNPHTVGDVFEQKLGIVDVLCSDENGDKFIVEMQKLPNDWSAERAVFYSSRIFSGQAKKGIGYSTLNRVYFVAILNFIMFPEAKEYRTVHKIAETTTGIQYLKSLEWVFVELPKFTAEHKEKLGKGIDLWAYFMTSADEVEPSEQQIWEGESAIEQAYTSLKMLGWTDSDILAYDKMRIDEFDEIAIRETAIRHGMQKGMEQGIEKGIEQGIQKGMEQGIQKGIEKGIEKEKLNNARNMLKAGIDKETVSKITGLSLNEIGKLYK